MIFVASATNVTEITAFSEDGAYAYALEVAGKYINASGDATDASALYSVSNGYKIVGSADPTCRAFFAFMDNECIGQLNVAFIDGRYFATYYSADVPLITEMYENNLPFALYYANDRVYLIDTEMSYVFNGAEDVSPFFSNVLNKTPITTSAITVPVSKSRVTRAASDRYLDVPIVANDVDYFGYGLCWAACVASIVMYKNPAYNLSSKGVLDQLIAYKGLTPSESEDVWSKDVLEAFGMYGVSMSYANSGATFNTVKNYINRNKPIYAGIYFNHENGHAVVISGYNQTDSEYWYQIMDPNRSEYCYVDVENPNSTTFVYVTNYGYTFRQWEKMYW